MTSIGFGSTLVRLRMESKSQDRELRLLERRIQDLDNPRELYHKLEQIKRARPLNHEEFSAQVRAMNDLGELTNEATALARALGFLPSLVEDNKGRFILGESYLEDIDWYWSQYLEESAKQSNSLDLYLCFFLVARALPIWEKRFKEAQSLLEQGFWGFDITENQAEPDDEFDRSVDWGADEWSEEEQSEDPLNIAGQQFRLPLRKDEGWHELVIELEYTLPLRKLVEALRTALMDPCLSNMSVLRELYSSYNSEKTAHWLAREGFFDDWHDFSQLDFEEFPDWANSGQAVTSLIGSLIGGRSIRLDGLCENSFVYNILNPDEREHAFQSAYAALQVNFSGNRKAATQNLQEEIFTDLMSLALDRPELLFPAADNSIEDYARKNSLGEFYEEGSMIRVKEGSFENYRGHIVKLDREGRFADVSLPVFGRQTIVRFELWQLEPADYGY